MCDHRSEITHGKCSGLCSGACKQAKETLLAKQSSPKSAPTPPNPSSPSSAATDLASSPYVSTSKKSVSLRDSPPSLDAVTTFGASGKRKMPQPAHSGGTFYSARTMVGLVLIAIFLSLPWIQINGAPAVFLDIAARRFHLFGLTFMPQDLWLAFFLISGLGFSLFVVTSLIGRVWCGWTCPLTVFLDMVRRVERWLEGDGPERKRMEGQPWTAGRAIRRSLKHVAMFLLAATLAHGFLAYFVSLPGLSRMMHEPPSHHIKAFVLVLGLTTVLWFNFAWFREQFCIVLCPYGRLQSVLTDEHTMLIGYDSKRGEPRGSKKTEPAGDCIDCLKCVQVCPTGIDIRQGLQLECIGCAACVDACNSIMQKLARPTGLIRYDSLAGLQGKKRRFWRPRIALYIALMLLGATAFSLGISTFHSASVSLIRMTGAPYFVQNGELRNQFLLRILNKRSSAETFQISVEGPIPAGLVLHGDQTNEIERWGEEVTPLIVTLPLQDWQPHALLSVVVKNAAGDVMARQPLKILGPETR